MRIVLGEADVKEGELRAYEVGTLNVCVARVDGRLKALDDWCNHAGCLLSGGRLEGNMVVCPCHEVGFDLDTGANLTSPGVCDDQPTFELRVEDGKLVLPNVVIHPPTAQGTMGHEEHDHPGAANEPSSAAVAEHRAQAPTHVGCYLVTCSDSRALPDDASGRALREGLGRAGHPVLGQVIVHDDADAIRGALQAAQLAGARAVLFTGGTGLTRRDQTVDTLRPLLDRELPGFGELFRMLSYQEIGSAAWLSRALAGTHGELLVFVLPGSPNAAKLALERLILPELGHAIRELSR